MNKRFGRIIASSLLVATTAVLGACSDQDTSSGSHAGQQQSSEAAKTSPSPDRAQSAEETTPSAMTEPNEADGSCSPAQTTLSLEDEQGAAGSTYYTLIVSHTGRTPCQLDGYPGVSAVDDSGQQIGQPAQRDDGTWEPVTLQPGKKATATLKVTNPDNLCPEERADSSKIRVYLPQRHDEALTEAHIGVCSGHETNLTISAFQAQE